MIMLAARRYAPNKSVDLQSPILTALGDQWLNVTTISARLGRSSDDSGVRYCLKMLTAAELVERKRSPVPRGFTYLYRRKPE